MTVRERTEAQERGILAPGAARASDSRGRRTNIEPCSIRTCYQRDRDRIIHCKSFRRLMHKTQVFLSPKGDHYRTRLTHTLEVSQIARTVARALRLNEDLTEAIALGHDLGHTPFGHAGESALNEVFPGGYRHAAQSVRVVEKVENAGAGLNLTWEVRNGIACHTGGEPAQTLEGQVVRYADKIAYTNHDIEDAVRAGVLLEEDIPWNVKCTLGRTKSERLTSCIVSLVENSNDAEIRMAPDCQAAHEELRAFMFDAVYTNPLAKGEEGKAIEIVKQLYRCFSENGRLLPREYRSILEAEGPERAACDYISGMTDRFCVEIYEELFVPKGWRSKLSDDGGMGFVPY